MTFKESLRSASRGRRRAAATGMALVATTVLVGATVVVAIGSVDDDDIATAPVTAATRTVTSGDLVDEGRLDGTVTSAGESTVIHRIDGVEIGAASAATGPAAPEAQAVALPWALSETALSEVGLAESGAEPAAFAVMVTGDELDGCAPSGPSTSTSAPPVPSTTMPVTTGPSITGPSTTLDSTTVTTVCGDEPQPGPTTTASEPGPSTTAGPATTAGPTTVDGPGSSTSTPAGPTGSGAGPDTGGSQTPVGGGGVRSGAVGGQSPVSGAVTPGALSGSTEPVTEVVTSLASVGDQIRSGDVLYTVDGAPVVALAGAVPAWRSLGSGDEGVDVEQLETALAALGYDPDGTLEIDQTYDRATAAVVSAWQQALGVEASGEVVLGQVVFVSDVATVISTPATVGDEVTEGSPILELDTSVQQVLAVVPVDERATVAVGLDVTVEGVPGRIVRLASATSDQGLEVQAFVALDQVLEEPTGAAVSVRFAVARANGVFTVPVEALVSRLDGSYAVRLVDSAGGPGQWLTVSPGAVAGGDVEVVADGLSAGMSVVVPAS